MVTVPALLVGTDGLYHHGDGPGALPSSCHRAGDGAWSGPVRERGLLEGATRTMCDVVYPSRDREPNSYTRKPTYKQRVSLLRSTYPKDVMVTQGVGDPKADANRVTLSPSRTTRYGAVVSRK